MNWLKRIFCSQEEFNSEINDLPEVTCSVAMPKVKPCKNETDISEPVISFIECVRKNPKRFSVKFDYTAFLCMSSTCKIKDSLTENEFSITIIHGCSRDLYVQRNVKSLILTDKELEYAYLEIKGIYEQRVKRLSKMKDYRERRKLTALYRDDK